MTVADFFDYLLGRRETRELALQLATVYETRRLTAVRRGRGA
jgi:hypothetical protein